MDGRENSVSDWLSIQNFNMDIYNKQVFSSASSVHVPQFVLEHLFIDSYKIEDNPQKSEKTEKKKSATALPVPVLTTLGTAVEAFGTTVVSYIGPIFIILTLQGVNVQLMRQLIVARMKNMEIVDALLKRKKKDWKDLSQM
ncbi:uncharacterized protein BN523_00468 [Bacteroides sp. CAG:189]|nr:uncharacterized protein BN523_00468 [Bacteroides sp. CAG:189]